MIVSAEMGNAAGDSEYLSSVIFKQAIYAVIGLVAYFLMSIIPVIRMKMDIAYFYIPIMALLVICRFYHATNGAYAWIHLGGISIQPSEFAKVFMILYGAKLLYRNRPSQNVENFWKYAAASMSFFVVILFLQHDLGSAIVLLAICFCILYIPSFKEYRMYDKIMRWIMMGAVFIGIPLVLSNPFTNLLKILFPNSYQVARFLAAADPFLYRYDNGYHLVMSLVSFANGNIFGLGYSNSIHKYMNFPNPSNDFILPVIVEELGIAGFGLILIGYLMILVPIVMFSMKTERTMAKIVSVGTIVYFASHFIFNVGGVSGFIPLTGVPLLMISSGGSSLIACMAAVGAVQNEIESDRVLMEKNENNSR